MEGLLVVISHGHIWLHPMFDVFLLKQSAQLGMSAAAFILLLPASSIWGQKEFFDWNMHSKFSMKWSILNVIQYSNSRSHVQWIHGISNIFLNVLIDWKFLGFLTNLPLLFKKTFQWSICLMLMYKMNVWYLNISQSPGDSRNSLA